MGEVSRRQAGFAPLFFLLGLLSFAFLPLVLRSYQNFYARNETYFNSPVPTTFSMLLVRNDGYGEGYFGASRNHGRKHEGIDLLAGVGVAVFAAKSGRVTFAGQDKGYGSYIEILHPDGLQTRYAHLSELNVVDGDWVLQGQMIGKSGKTGNAKNPHIQPHLHFEIRCEGQALDPAIRLLNPSIAIK